MRALLSLSIRASQGYVGDGKYAGVVGTYDMDTLYSVVAITFPFAYSLSIERISANVIVQCLIGLNDDAV